MKKSLSLLAYAIIVFVTISSCSKKKDDPAPSNSNTNTNNSTSKYYFKGTFGGAAYNQASAASTTAYNNGIGASSVGNYVDYANSDAYVYEFYEGSFWTKFSYQNNQFTEIDGLVIEVHKSFSYIGEDYPSEQDIKNIYAAGTYTNFSTAATSGSYPTTQGWDIELTDDNGKVWSSYKGTADQTGSYIKIDSQKDVYETGARFLSAKGSVSCKLYDDSGNVKVLEGTFNQLFSDYSVD